MTDFRGDTQTCSAGTRALLEARLKERSTAGTRPTIGRRDRNTTAPLSFGQQRLWFLDQLTLGNPFYNVTSVYRVRGVLDRDVLRRALAAVVGRHEALRTTFEVVDGRPAQRVAVDQPLELPVVDIRGLTEAESETRTDEWIASEARLPFDLARGPLLRAGLLRLADQEHLLRLTMHHIVSDGWSMGIFMRELARFFEEFSGGRPAALAELPIQYADFARWQREWLSGQVLEKQLSYWRKQLADLPILKLPTDRPRPFEQTFRGAQHRTVFSERLTKSLKELSQREGATLYMTLLAAFQALLLRYTRQEDIVVGSPIANRTREEIEGLIGFFVNTLVLRTNLSENPSFRELLGRVREVSLQAYAHQDLPFEKLVEELQPERDLGQNPLVQVVFSLQNTPAESFQLAGVEVLPLPVETRTTRFDLEVYLWEFEGCLMGNFVYATDLFDATTIERLTAHFQTLLEAAVADPDRRVWELPLLAEAERRQMLVGWNETERVYPRDETVHRVFEEHLKRTPEVEAVAFGQERLTYRSLNERANRLARYLSKRGVGPEVLVGLCVDRSLEMIVGLLGILKAGGAYVPLDPGYPRQRLAFMLEDTAARVVVTQQSLMESLPTGPYERVRIDADWGEIEKESGENPVSTAASGNLAYVIYTSGSTGQPKGVSILHRSIVRLVKGADYATFGSEEVFLQFAPISFDASTFEIWGALLNGARLAIMPPGLPSLEELSAALERYEVSTLWLTAGLFHQMAEPQMESLRGLRQLLAGGDVLSVPLVEKVVRELPGCRLINGYGPTENTTFTCCHTVQRGEPLGASVPIGRPIANTRVYILDRNREPVPIGIPGELHVGGDGLARGYVNDPALTAEKFVANPFGGEVGSRLYKTGDLARYLADGNVEFLGRLDNQVKIRGFRIEPGEIESVLAQHQSVAGSVVVPREDTPGDRRLVAYVVPRDGESPSVTQLCVFLKTKLPDYMVPAAFVFLDALPLTPNGKVNRRALPAPDAPSPEGFMAPRDLLELQLAKIWEKTLRFAPIGVRDNFFELGGHSLLAMNLFAEYEKQFDRSLPLATLFQAPTVEGLAAKLREKGWKAPWSSLVVIQGGQDRPPLFCVPGVGGNVLGFYDLAQELGPDQPVYGLQAPGLDGKQKPLTRIEDMAAHYLKEIKAVLPDGPYLLAGACFGGSVAFEIARQLEAEGRSVSLVALFDAVARRDESSSPWLTVARRRLKGYGARLAYHGKSLIFGSERVSYIDAKSRTLRRRIRSRIWQMIYKAYRSRSETLPRVLHDVREAGYLANREYVPGPYGGKVKLFRAQERSAADAGTLDMGWGRLALGGVEILEVPGDHVDMLKRPHVTLLAAQLRECIDKASGKQPQDPLEGTVSAFRRPDASVRQSPAPSARPDYSAGVLDPRPIPRRPDVAR